MIVDLGSYVQVGGRPAVRFERLLPAPIERVWAAVTDPEQLPAWFPSQVRYEPRVGGEITFLGDPNLPEPPQVDRVLAWDPPHRFAFGWGGDEIHLELSRTEAGCRLVLLNVLVSADTAARNATGWYGCLGELDKVLQGIPSDGPHSQPLADFWPLHDAHVAAGLPHGAWIPDEVLAARPS
ncbi:SRPBCC family protein [Nakamurella multipartita]|jgi:uncharacterized protein YndB with AHSA1/START domain|uniref:Activator of Hsp90 ATPase 1 family protein n=1 Tax=Nakamurella multipartita (strain ATCC 700099 / DSM 44233 / CIP 104796 / JCM 9543 / NBRC 105858 / Y-104) TaxID=479431 RepID=C8XBE8_NAKMY|nr:SRPBCC family protein [Nakamurella multipartita]ACV77410.1 Activator of Hsp90 ATPase 1 family protein [Nakamurella multipartita DSM 44233]